MKYLFLLGILYTLQISGFSQDTNASLYAFKKDWTAAHDMDSATYFMYEVDENDTTYVCKYYNKMGPMIKWETYRDSSLTIPHGIWVWYNTQGYIDSVGEFSNGKKDKGWRYGINEKGDNKLTEEYSSGVLVKKTDYVNKKEWINGEEFELKDSSLANQKSIENPNLSKNDAKKKAEFKNGGIPGWMKYIGRKLKTPDRFTYNWSPGTSATVIIEFIVNTDGNISNILIEHSVEWSVDMETIKIIKNSPPWSPAIQDGKFVIDRFRQGFTYKVNQIL